MVMAKRIRVRTPDVSGGGGGPPVTPNVQWGPDFGDGPADGITVTHEFLLDLAKLGLVAGMDTQYALDLQKLAMQTQVAHDFVLDLERLGLTSALAHQYGLDLDSLGMAGGVAHTNALDLDSLAMSGGVAHSHALAGTVVGPPVWIATETHSEVSATGGSSISVNVPTHEEGDLLIVDTFATRMNADMTADQAGWTLIGGANASNTNTRLRQWYRFASASEPASYSFTTTTSATNQNATNLAITSYRGAHPTSPIDDSAFAFSNSDTDQVAFDGVTASVDNVMRHVVGAVGNTLNVTQTDYSFAELTDFVEVYDIGVQSALATAANCDGALDQRVQASSGAVPGGNFTISPDPTLAIGKVSSQVIIAPDPAGIPL